MEPRTRPRLLHEIDLFRDAVRPDAERIARMLGTQTYRSGERIVGPQTPADRIYVVVEGTVRLFHRGPDGREITADSVGPGRLFGISALYGPPRDGLLAEAVGNVVICSAEADDFLRLVSQSPSIMCRLVTQLASRLLAVEEQLGRLTGADARTRVADALHRLALDVGEDVPGGGRRIRLKLTHAALARQIGSSRETVTRALASLEDEGHIRREGRRLVVNNAQRLSEMFGLAGPG